MGGVYVSVSYENPINREHHFERDHLGFYLKTIKINDKVFGDIKIDNFIYVCKKSKDAEKLNKKNYARVIKQIKHDEVQNIQLNPKHI